MKPIDYYNDTWKMNYHFFIGWKQIDFKKYIIKHFDKNFEMEDGVCGMMRRLYTNRYFDGCLIWTKRKKDYGTLAHECLHATNRTLERAGWCPELDNDEPQTYLMTILINKALRR